MITTLDPTAVTPANPSTVAAHAADRAEIHALFAQLAEHWNNGDGAAYASLFTEDADYVTFDGTRHRGRRANAEMHQAMFDGPLGGTRLAGEIDSVRFPTPDTAVVHGRGHVTSPWEARKGAPKLDKIQTYVLVRRDGRWWFTAFQNTPIKPVPTSGLGFRLYATFLAVRAAIWRLTGR